MGCLYIRDKKIKQGQIGLPIDHFFEVCFFAIGEKKKKKKKREINNKIIIGKNKLNPHPPGKYTISV